MPFNFQKIKFIELNNQKRTFDDIFHFQLNLSHNLIKAIQNQITPMSFPKKKDFYFRALIFFHLLNFYRPQKDLGDKRKIVILKKSKLSYSIVKVSNLKMRV